MSRYLIRLENKTSRSRMSVKTSPVSKELRISPRLIGRLSEPLNKRRNGWRMSSCSKAGSRQQSSSDPRRGRLVNNSKTSAPMNVSSRLKMLAARMKHDGKQISRQPPNVSKLVNSSSNSGKSNGSRLLRNRGSDRY